MNVKAIGVGAGAIIIALGGLSAYQVLRDSSSALDELVMAPAPREMDEREQPSGAAIVAPRATPTPFGLMVATVGPRRSWTISPTPATADDAGGGAAEDEGETPVDAIGESDAPGGGGAITGGGTLGVAPEVEEEDEARREERIRRLRAALPTPLPPYHTPTPTPEPVYFPTSVPREDSEALWAGEFNWLSYEREGYRFMYVEEGEAARILVGSGFVSEFDCEERLRLTLDEATNVAYDSFSHFIWIWAETAEGSRGCWGVPAGVDWRNKPVSRARLSADDIEAWRAVDMDEPLLFGEGEFHTPPLEDNVISYGRILIEDDGWDGLCHIYGLPWAVWDVERGFWALLDDDIRVRSEEFFEEEEYAGFAEARARGYYVIVNDGVGEPEHDAYCWRVANAAEVPTRPCYECQLWDIENVLASEEVE